ncbi:hypothetical protein CIW48_07315 [Methylobacterium sp. P1-11]|uniref:hypothetical protein n=1 Tax=Methylobacterium sp. P1-11 TaxID=2024616 RepID=UPI0011EC3C81|nr:hypothetical protein [Methylobacterium sp. P1-11]KAA0124564.1 hypothetical protein CIW48_07315 [Methylobacterium sp. P1-11]
MLANARDARRRTMLKSDLRPPEAGLDADPILYGVAAGLADLFPPVIPRAQSAPEPGRSSRVGRSRDTTETR